MRKSLLAFFVSVILLSACRKNDIESPGLSGSWRLIQVDDKSTGTTTYRPAGANMDVVIKFLNGNSFSGHTIRNGFSDGTFSKNGNAITFGSFSMTKVQEDEWGGSFITVLHSCYLQSVSPCSPSTITIRGNLMKITTALRYDVTLEKI